MIKKHFHDRIVASTVCVSFVLSVFTGCASDTKNTDNTITVSETPATSTVITTQNTIYEETTITTEISEQIDNGKVDDIYSLVCSFVDYELSNAGFTVENGMAYTKDENYKALGLYYFDDNIKLFESSESIKPVGFVEIVDDDKEFFQADKIEDLIFVDPVEESSEDTEMICTYNYVNIGTSHFVYKHKYVIFYQETAMRIVYNEQTIDCEDVYDYDGYDLSLGSIYDYDNNQYIYDESLFTAEDNYVNHTSVGLFDNSDYTKLEKDLRTFSNMQLEDGYVVEELSIVYISPENIQAYLDSEEEDTFFGYSVDDLTSSFGLGTALEYKNGKLMEADLSQNMPDEYDWKSFLGKVCIGTGIVIVVAVVAAPFIEATIPVFIMSTVGKAGIASAASSLVSLAIETGKNYKNDITLKEALLGASGKALETFANTYILTCGILCAKPVAKLVQYKLVGGAEANELSVAYLRQRAVNKAWEKELKLVTKGKSKYPWTEAQKAELLATGKVAGFDGHHIKTVKELENTISKWLIGDADDIILLSEENHKLIHCNNFKNPTDMGRLLELCPWVVKQLPKIAIAA